MTFQRQYFESFWRCMDPYKNYSYEDPNLNEYAYEELSGFFSFTPYFSGNAR
jgi:hypothetical protein